MVDSLCLLVICLSGFRLWVKTAWPSWVSSPPEGGEEGSVCSNSTGHQNFMGLNSHLALRDKFALISARPDQIVGHPAPRRPDPVGGDGRLVCGPVAAKLPDTEGYRGASNRRHRRQLGQRLRHDAGRRAARSTVCRVRRLPAGDGLSNGSPPPVVVDPSTGVYPLPKPGQLKDREYAAAGRP